MINAGPYPPDQRPEVWPPPRSLATTCGISVDVSSSPYLDVSVQAVPPVRLWIHRTVTRYCRAGLPHSVICGSKLMCSSPQLIAACHDLLRLLMPRHPPCALFSLTCFWFSLSRIMQTSSGSIQNCIYPNLNLSLCCLAFSSSRFHCSVFKVQFRHKARIKYSFLSI